TLKELISQTMVRWSQEDQIQDPELVRIMYSLLRRQYDSIGELLQALRKAYTISAASVKDTINLLAALGQIRSLLSVRMGKEEELLMINGLGCSPLHLPGESASLCFLQNSFNCKCVTVLDSRRSHKKCITRLGDILYCISRPLKVCIHLYLLNKCLTTIKHYLGITYFFHRVPQVTSLLHTSIKKFSHQPIFLLLQPFGGNFYAVVTYLAGCGLQSCPVLLAKGYPDIGWNPIEGERYLSFLRFAVFANSESVEENASVVVKLLIR
ncbi:RYR2 protein, partial [Erythrocercus mccallii]|nr:RYR2 protein [Erythrocercus mccallii]